MADHDRKLEASPVPFEEALDKAGNGAYNVCLTSACALTLLAIGADLFGFSLVVTAACDLQLSVTEQGILTSLPFIGILLVSYFWGYVSDTRGRRFTLLLSLQTSFLLSSLASLAPNWLALATLKFFSVCFSCAANSASYTLVGECCAPRVRSRHLLLMTCLLLLSPAAAAVLAYPTLRLGAGAALPWLGIVFSPWRALCLVLALPLGASAAVLYFFHESPKFLANAGRDQEALEVLRSMYAVNYRRPKSEFEVSCLQAHKSADGVRHGGGPRSLLHNMWLQTAPLFRPPLLLRTLQLYYIVAVVYITNNSFLVWLPQIMNLLRAALEAAAAERGAGGAGGAGGALSGNLCALITAPPRGAFNATDDFQNTTIAAPTKPCRGVEDNSLFTLMASQVLFCCLNFVISCLPRRRRAVLLAVLALSALSGALVNLMPEPVSSVFFFVVFTCTSLGMGILASYFVDLFPTSYRGMAACLSIMVGRSSTFVGINLLGSLLFSHCAPVFYLWSLLVFTSAAAAWFLPPDEPPQTDDVTRL